MHTVDPSDPNPRGGKGITVRLPGAVHRRLHALAAIQGSTIQAILGELVAAYLRDTDHLLTDRGGAR